MKISVWDGGLSETYLKQVTQLGADCIDFGNDGSFPGVKEQGYPDLDELLKMRKLIRSYGLDINRVTLPNITEKFMKGQPEGEIELENTCNALKVFAEAGVPIARQRFWGDTFDFLMSPFIQRYIGVVILRVERVVLQRRVHPLHRQWKNLMNGGNVSVKYTVLWFRLQMSKTLNSLFTHRMCQTPIHLSEVSVFIVSLMPSQAEMSGIYTVAEPEQKLAEVPLFLMR